MRDGRIKHILERWQTFAHAGDLPARAIGICQDITERKLADAALRQSQAMLARTERIAHIGSWEWEAVSYTHLTLPTIYSV